MLYYNHGGRGLTPEDYLTSKDIDLENIRVFGQYFYVGNKLYYNYKPVSNQPGLAYIVPPIGRMINFNWKQEKVKPTDADFSFINADKLQIIPFTEYLTDETYLIYQNNIVGKIDYNFDSNNVNVICPYFIESETHYYCRNLMIEKSKLATNPFGVNLKLNNKSNE